MLCIARKDKIFDVHLDARQIHFCIVRCPLLSLSLCEGGKKIMKCCQKLSYVFLFVFILLENLTFERWNNVLTCKRHFSRGNICIFCDIFLFLTPIPSGREMRGNWKVRPVTRTIWNERNFEIFAKFVLNFCNAEHTDTWIDAQFETLPSDHCAIVDP